LTIRDYPEPASGDNVMQGNCLDRQLEPACGASWKLI